MDVTVLDYEAGEVVIFTDAIETKEDLEEFLEEQGFEDPEEIEVMVTDKITLVMNPE